MSREILFKAKRIDNGEWVKGNLIYNGDGAYIAPLVKYSNLGYCLECNRPFDDCYDVDTSTICQYTGLKDKNGKKIWENDIVRNGKGDIGVVQWFEEHAVFMIWNKTKHHVYYLAENDFSKIEIVGNEFDNPELLEGECKER